MPNFFNVDRTCIVAKKYLLPLRNVLIKSYRTLSKAFNSKAQINLLVAEAKKTVDH